MKEICKGMGHTDGVIEDSCLLGLARLLRGPRVCNEQ